MIVLAILEILTMIHSAIVGLSYKFSLKEFILAEPVYAVHFDSAEWQTLVDRTRGTQSIVSCLSGGLPFPKQDNVMKPTHPSP